MLEQSLAIVTLVVCTSNKAHMHPEEFDSWEEHVPGTAGGGDSAWWTTSCLQAANF